MLLALCGAPAFAQSQPGVGVPPVMPEGELEEVVVSGRRSPGSVIGDIPPEISLSSQEIRALGDQVVPHHDHIRLEGLQTRVDDGVRVTDALDTPRGGWLIRARHGGDDTITGPGSEQQLGGAGRETHDATRRPCERDLSAGVVH